MRLLHLVFLLFLSENSIAKEDSPTSILFSCHSENYNIIIHKNLDNTLSASVSNGKWNKIVNGGFYKVDIFSGEKDSAKREGDVFSYFYNARMNYEAYSLEFKLENLNIDVYQFYDESVSSDISYAFWVKQGENKKNYACEANAESNLYMLNDILWEREKAEMLNQDARSLLNLPQKDSNSR